MKDYRLSYHIGFGRCKARRTVYLFHAVIIEVKSIEIDSGGNWWATYICPMAMS
jgi:hypothetical protein